MEESTQEYLRNNEFFINKCISRILFFALPFFPLLILLKYMNVFPDVDVVFLGIGGIILGCFCLFNYFFQKYNPESHISKYYVLGGISLIVLWITLNEGLSPYLIYLLPISISVFYFDKLFTLEVSVLSLIVFITSTIMRGLIRSSVTFYRIKDPLIARANSIVSILVGGGVEIIMYAIFAMYLATTIKKILVSLYNNQKSVQKTQDELILSFANMIEAKDELTGEHIKRTSEYVKLICQKLMENNIYPEFVTEHTSEVMVRAAPFHDLGKIGIPDRILNKPGKLTPEEFEIIKNHPEEGAEFIIKKLGSLDDMELVQTARDMALFHHEHMDGSGYPHGLLGDDIPVSARIMAVADVLDALLSERSYKPAYDLETSFKILKELSGESLDPFIVSVLLCCKREIQTIQATGVLE